MLRTCGWRLGLIVWMACVLASPARAEDPAAGKQVPQSVEVKGGGADGDAKVTLHYWLYLPAEYGKKADAKWPLVLFLHGAGERGDNLEAVKKHGPPKLVATQSDFPAVLVSPQCPSNSRWKADQLIQLIDHIQKSQAIDANRVYCTGLSMGGFGTWSLTAAYPDRFAAAAPICGGGNPATAEKLKNLPLWVFHGEKDTAVRPEQSKDMVAAIEKAGGKPKLTLYPDAGHDSWTETYNNKDFWKWLFEQKRSQP